MKTEQLQEAKDKGAQMQGFTSFVGMMGTDNLKSGRIEGSINNALGIIFKAGQDDQAQFFGEQLTNQVAVIVKLRKALEEIAEYGPIMRSSAHDDIDDLKRIAREALGE